MELFNCYRRYTDMRQLNRKIISLLLAASLIAVNSSFAYSKCTMGGGEKSCCSTTIPSSSASISVSKSACHCPAMTAAPKQNPDKTLPVSKNNIEQYKVSLVAPTLALSPVPVLAKFLNHSINKFSLPASDRIIFLQVFLI